MDPSGMDWPAEFHYHGISDALLFDSSIVPFDPSPTPSGSGKSSESISEYGPTDVKYSPLGYSQLEVGIGLDPPKFGASASGWKIKISPEVLLDVARKAGLRLNNLIGLQPEGESHRCLALFAVISNQISDILGASLSRHEVMKNTQSLPMISGSGSGSGSSMQHNASLERLDGINALISSYHPTAAKTDDGHNQHHIALLQRLSDEVESNLVIIWKIMNLGDRSREMPWDLEGDGTQQTMGSGAFFVLMIM
ncbi:hypothetical protein VP1G_10811 [Cytospora mali]|uniref:Uncharacterized protein n=1 Tax=Cytospora mali TaxID=578113 RepID=A0A194UXR0_CYTMA|nr:hypothetical protein VP1G_10811 [Valsa mali var. pyri (nom. inval.)]